MKVRFHIPNFLDKLTGSMNMALVYMVKNTPQMFYDGVEIASVFDCFPVIWNGGRVIAGYLDMNTLEKIVPLYLNHFNSSGIPCRFTFTNPMLTREHLGDPVCNRLLDIADNGLNEAIVFSPLLEEHIRKNHPGMKITSSTCKQIRDVKELTAELEKDYSLVVLDYNFNNKFDILERLPHKEKCEILINSPCAAECPRRAEHYRHIGNLQLESCNPRELAKIKAGEAAIKEWSCPSMKHNAFTRRSLPLHITPEDIYTRYVQMGFSNFKIEGRGRNFPDLAEQYVYYMARPEYRDIVRYNLIRTAADSASGGSVSGGRG